MDLGAMRTLVVTALNDLQILSGRPTANLTGVSKPIGTLEGFDSFNGVELTCELEKKLACVIPAKENLCVEDLPSGKKRSRTVDEIASRLLGFTKGSV
jgi:hypothetical protein